MKNYIDLSYTIENGLAVHPYDDKIVLERNKFLEDDKYNDTRLQTGMHVGTHIDAPSHLLDNNKLICDYNLEKFIGNGILIDVRNQNRISMKDEYKDKINENDIVLLYTGYDIYFGSDRYFNNHPVIETDFAEFLINKNIKLIGMDMPSPDHYPFEIHKKFLSNDILIIENLVNLNKLLDLSNFEIIAIPLKIKAEASILRVIAKY